MGYSLDTESSAKTEPSKDGNFDGLSPQANESLKFQEKCAEKPFGRPYLDWHHDLKQSSGDRLLVHLKSPKDHKKQLFRNKSNRDDELVKHMSNLPGYLQRVERGENLQEKALNFGVLEWERLEKWKHNGKSYPARGNTKTSSSNRNSSFKATGPSALSKTGQQKPPVPRRNQSSAHSSHINSLDKDRISLVVQQSRGEIMHSRNFASVQRSIPSGLQNGHSRSVSSGRIYSERKLDRALRKELDEKATSKREVPLSGLRKHGFSLSSHDSLNSQDCEIKAKVKEELDLAKEQGLGKQQNIVLLLPKHSSRKSFTGSSYSESGAVLKETLTEASGLSFSDCVYLEDLHSRDFTSEIPHSCPLPACVMSSNEADMNQLSFFDSQSKELQSGASYLHQFADEIPTPDKTKLNNEISSTFSVEASKRLDQGSTEKSSLKGRHPSPNRRFSFTLGRIGRSFSLKESSDVPQFSSTYASIKSVPERSEACGGIRNFNNEQKTAGSRTRSSPLRRLLDPLLKPKEARSDKSVRPSKGTLQSVSLKALGNSNLVQAKMHERETVQALLQVAIKSGVPFFKLVVDNSNDILAAAVQKLPVSGIEDSDLLYAFYSVREVKKKSGGWINQGSKGKNCDFGYSLVGQMKVCRSYASDINGKQSCDDHHLVRESTLYSFDLEPTDKETPELVPSRELAAIVVKNLMEKNNDGKQWDKDKTCTCLLEDTCEKREKGNNCGTSVILPGGIHGLPNKGLPSSLINRWRSGGSCDCGGWDVGCKLHILTDEDQSSRTSKPMSCCSPGRFDLFIQGGHEVKKPIFSMAPFKNGLYSVEYSSSSVTLLQAFSICVAVISSRKSSEILEEVNSHSEAKLFPETTPRSCCVKIPTTVQLEASAKYVPPPPPSPAGRV